MNAMFGTFFFFASAVSAWEQCNIDTTTVGCDIADNAAKFPNPFAWYTNTSYPGVTLPGPARGKHCNWTVGENFIWNTTTNQCILNGQGYPLSNPPACYNGHYATNEADFKATYLAWQKLALTQAKKEGGAYVAKIKTDGKTVEAAMSVGHGVLSGLCGDCALIRLGDKYVAQLQSDVRAWSLELSSGANTWLASDNVGGTCYIPDVKAINCSAVFV